MYQPKTLVICLSVGAWSEHTNVSPTDMGEASVAAATFIGIRCGMDLMSLTHIPGDTQRCSTIAVYVSNGVTFAQIRRIMAAYIDNRPKNKIWMIQDWEETEEGILYCVTTVRSYHEDWD